MVPSTRNFNLFLRARSLASAPMRRPSPWLILVVILLGAFILREPRLQQVEDIFLSWFMEHAEAVLPPAQSHWSRSAAKISSA